MNEHLKVSIMKHLSAKADTWASTVEKVKEETGAGPLFVERAMKDLVECRHLKRLDQGGMPTYTPAGKIDGKYSPYNQKRLAPEKGWAQKYEDHPWHSDIKGPKAV
jgi:hypothetical protein